MKSIKNTVRIVGALFLVAMVASLVGGGMIESELGAGLFQNGVSFNETFINTGVFLEIINTLAVAGIGILLYPILKKKNEQVAIGYVSFRILEMVSCLSAAIVPLLIIEINRESISAEITDLLIVSRAQITGIFIPLFFSLGALIFYNFLYKTELLPRFISIWGFIGVALIIVLNLFNFKTSLGMILALPIILNEIFLGIWLITKGFNQTNLKILNQKMSSD